MKDSVETFLWKIKERKHAEHNKSYGENFCDDRAESVPLNESTQKLYIAVCEDLETAEQYLVQTAYHPIVSSRRIIGRVICFAKKTFRKLLHVTMGWYINPILQSQTAYNERMFSVACLQKDIALKQEAAIIRQKSTIEEQNEIIKCLREMQNQQQKKMEKQDELLSYIMGRLGITCDIKLLEHTAIDYFDFEDQFRGPREQVMKIQSHYLEYFRVNGGKEILDIGCGRGEFLELLTNHALPVRGIDAYPPFVEYCINRGYHVTNADALTYLSQLDDNSLGGIFMGQVVEHLSPDYLQSLIVIAYKKLITGCFFIIETPNPDSLAAISEFNIDISHIKPVHYKSLEYLFKFAKYQNVTRYYSQETLYPYRASHIQGEGISNCDEFNQGIDNINNLLFGYRDYTLIAKK